MLGNFAGPVDHVGIDSCAGSFPACHERLRSGGFVRIFDGMRMNQIEAESAEEELTNEAWTRPLALTRRFCNVSCLFLRGRTGRVL